MCGICLLINNTKLLDKQRLSLKLAKNAKQREAQIEICVVYKKKRVMIMIMFILFIHGLNRL